VYVVNPCDIGVSLPTSTSRLPVAGERRLFGVTVETFQVEVPAPSSLLLLRVPNGIVDVASLPEVIRCVCVCVFVVCIGILTTTTTTTSLGLSIIASSFRWQRSSL
jgi:hypothetical protein